MVALELVPRFCNEVIATLDISVMRAFSLVEDFRHSWMCMRVHTYVACGGINNSNYIRTSRT